MRYISTRGQAPVRDFAGVLLAGLAEDGGLYVPEAWPHFTAADWRALRGLAYPALAARVMQPFVGDAIPSATLQALCRDSLCRLRPSRRRAAGPARHRPVRAGAVPRADACLQGHGAATAWPPVRPCADDARRARDDCRGHLGRHRLRRDRGIRRSRPRRHHDPSPARPHQRGAAAPDDDGSRRRMSATSQSRERSTTARIW